MPQFIVTYPPSYTEPVPDATNLLTIALKCHNGVYNLTSLKDFDKDQKSDAFDLIFAHGVGSPIIPSGLVLQRTHPSYVQKKENREIHAMFSNVLVASLVSFKQYLCLSYYN